VHTRVGQLVAESSETLQYNAVNITVISSSSSRSLSPFCSCHAISTAITSPAAADAAAGRCNCKSLYYSLPRTLWITRQATYRPLRLWSEHCAAPAHWCALCCVAIHTPPRRLSPLTLHLATAISW